MTDKPNLLFIFSDQQRCDTLECYGNELIRTPHLDALSRESFLFEHPYVTQPVCTPSRATLFTGLFPHTSGCTNNGFPINRKTPTFAEMVQSGYQRTFTGRFHIGVTGHRENGFEFRSLTEWSRPPDLCGYQNFLLDKGVYNRDKDDLKFSRLDAASRIEERSDGIKLTPSAYVGGEVVRLLKEYKSKPFVLFAGFIEPHAPHNGPYPERIPPDKVSTGPAFFRKPASDAALFHRLRAEYDLRCDSLSEKEKQIYLNIDLNHESGWREMKSRYWGLISRLDTAVGQILEALDFYGLSDNTIVIYTSDHGGMVGDHGIFAKQTLYEEAVKVPLLIRIPWMSRKKILIEGNISHIDLVPTLLDLLNQPVPSHLEGRSRKSVLLGRESLELNDVFIESNKTKGPYYPHIYFPPDRDKDEIIRIMNSPWRTIVTADRWKLGLNSLDQCELYDLNNDPFEETNLFNQSTQIDRIKQMTEKLKNWQKQTGDIAPLPG